MIKIKIDEKNKKIARITVSGHANFAELGEDIVCASVSSIVITTVNALIKLDENSVEYLEKDGLVDLKILNNNKPTEILVLNMIELLKELENQYPKNIKIK